MNMSRTDSTDLLSRSDSINSNTYVCSLLHIGLPSTGTGTWQSQIFPRLGKLNKLAYYGKVYDNGHRTSFYYPNQPKYQKQRNGKDIMSVLPFFSHYDMDNMIDHVMDSIDNPKYKEFNRLMKKRWIFSHEGVTHQFSDFGKLSILLEMYRKIFNCHVIISLRDPADFVWSRFWNWIERGKIDPRYVSFEEFSTFWLYSDKQSAYEHLFNPLHLIIGKEKYIKLELKTSILYFDSISVANSSIEMMNFCRRFNLIVDSELWPIQARNVTKQDTMFLDKNLKHLDKFRRKVPLLDDLFLRKDGLLVRR